MSHTVPTAAGAPDPTSRAQRRLWLAAAWLTIGYVVLTFVAAVFQKQVVLGDGPGRVSAALVTSSLPRTFGGEYVEYLATLLFLAAALLFARLIPRRDEVGGWLSSCLAGLAVTHVAVTFATAGAAGAAALYDGHHGVPLGTVTAINDIRNIGYSLAGGAAGAYVLAASAAGQLARTLPRWFSYAGYAVGAICVAAVPAVRSGAPQTLLWFAWLLALGLLSLRRGRATARVPRAAMATA